MFGEKSCHHPTKHAKNGKSFQNQPSFFGGHQQIFRSHVCSLFLFHGCLSFFKSKSTEKFHLGGCRQGIQLRMNLALTKKRSMTATTGVVWGVMYQVIQFVTFSSPIVGGHLTISKGHLTIAKSALWITRYMPGKQSLLLISIKFTPKNSHSCRKKW